MKRIVSRMLVVFVMTGLVAACGTTAKAPMSPADAVKAKMASVKKEIKQVTPAELKQWKTEKKNVTILDARTRKEYAGGFVPGATNIPRGLFEFLVPKLVKDTKAPIVVYCKVGGRGALATKTLKDIGYTNVYNLNGGYMGWVKAGNPVEKK